MDKMLEYFGNVVGVAGVLVCLLAGAARVAGSHYLMGFESITLLIGGISLMVAACLAKLQQLTLR